MGKWYRVRQAALVILTGGVLLQTTAGCEEQLTPLITNIVTSLVINALLGGLVT